MHRLTTQHGLGKRAGFWTGWLLLFGIASLSVQAAENDRAIQLIDITSQSGITFRHTDGGSGRQYIVELMVAGLALFDYDGDDRIDIYLLNGAPMQGSLAATPRNGLYRNLGGGQFVDVSEQAGVGDAGHGLGVTAGDYDNDGDCDLYVNNYGSNVLYRNAGDGTFTDVSQPAGVTCGSQVGAGACFLDMDRDGDLDLYVAHYVDFSPARHAVRAVKSYPYPPGPGDYAAVPDTLYRNNGDGSFTDVSRVSGVATKAGASMGMVCFDFDEDGDTDVFVCNDGMANFLFENDGRGRFEEQGLLAGTAYNLHGEENGSMGVDCGDFDNDGRLDLFMTDYTSEMPVLYRNLPGGFFEDVTNATGAGAAVYPHTNWGTGLVDLDNDGDRDLFIACGHFLANIPEIDDRTLYRVRNTLLMNAGGKKFVDVSARCGDGLAVVESSRGAGFDDLDNDGDLDVVVLNANAAPTVLRNDSHVDHHWAQIHLRGTRSNRDGVGSRVRVVSGPLDQVAEAHSGRGYQSHYGTRLHFGLGPRRGVDRVEVRWPSGLAETFSDSPADRRLTLIEGTGDAMPRLE